VGRTIDPGDRRGYANVAPGDEHARDAQATDASL
jgi:hypothetical protein